MRVLISGAGIAGPTLAYWLAQADVQVTVLDKSAALLAQGQNIDIEGTAVSVIKKMGIFDEVRRANTTEAGTRFVDATGRTIAEFPINEKSGLSPTRQLEILRGDLALILYKATVDLPNVTYRFGTSVTEVVSNDEASVTVRLSTGAVEEYDLLVAADGQWSRIRKDVFPADATTIVDKDMYVAYFTMAREPGDADWWTIYNAGGARSIHTRPDPHGTFRACLAMMPTDAGTRAAWQGATRRGDGASQQALARATFADAGWQAPRVLAAMADAPDFYVQALQQIRLRPWSRGRVVCVGDAAYAPTPLTGQGTPLAILGAYMLAGELSRLAGEHPARALAAYEAALRPHVEKQQSVPFFVPRIVHPTSATGLWLLRALVATAAWVVSLSWVQAWFGKEDAESNNDGFPLPLYPAFEEREAGDEKSRG